MLMMPMLCAPSAHADPMPVIPVPVPTPGGIIGAPIVSNPIANVPGAAASPGIGGEPGIGFNAPSLAPAAAGIFLCPGVGAAGSSLGGGGGYCDFDFRELIGGRGNMHVHCEWGGFVPLVEAWNCWRVFPGQPDHPRLLDPDIIPDGWGVPWGIAGPTPDNQWPPAGLAPAEAFQPPPPPPPE